MIHIWLGRRKSLKSTDLDREKSVAFPTTAPQTTSSPAIIEIRPSTTLHPPCHHPRQEGSVILPWGCHKELRLLVNLGNLEIMGGKLHLCICDAAGKRSRRVQTFTFMSHTVDLTLRTWGTGMFSKGPLKAGRLSSISVFLFVCLSSAHLFKANDRNQCLSFASVKHILGNPLLKILWDKNIPLSLSYSLCGRTVTWWAVVLQSSTTRFFSCVTMGPRGTWTDSQCTRVASQRPFVSAAPPPSTLVSANNTARLWGSGASFLSPQRLTGWWAQFWLYPQASLYSK